MPCQPKHECHVDPFANNPGIGEILLICDRAHTCGIEPCIHKQPHQGTFPGKTNTCGHASVCSPYVNEVSACIPVIDGYYTTMERKVCPHCKGQGYERIYTRHKVKEVENE
jgi:hypothetical protein